MKILLHVRCRQDVATGVCFKYMAYFCSYAICDHLAKAGRLTNYPWPSYVDDRGRCCGVAQTPGGGTLGISGWGCAAGSLEPLTFTRASSAEFCHPKLE